MAYLEIECTAAESVLRKYLKDAMRSFLGERGSALTIDPETGCTAPEMFESISPAEPQHSGNRHQLSDHGFPLGSGWDVKTCPECAEGWYALEVAERCLKLHQAVINANSIEEVRLALRAHQESRMRKLRLHSGKYRGGSVRARNAGCNML